METQEIELGKVIRRGLLRKDIKQVDLANHVGVSSASVSEWIKGKKKPSADALLKIAEYLDIIDDLFPSRQKADNSSIVTKKDLHEVYNKIEQINEQIRVLSLKVF